MLHITNFSFNFNFIALWTRPPAMILTATVDSERSGGGIELRGAVGGAWNYRGQRGGRGRSEAKKRSRQRCGQGRSRLSRSEGRSGALEGWSRELGAIEGRGWSGAEKETCGLCMALVDGTHWPRGAAADGDVPWTSGPRRCTSGTPAPPRCGRRRRRPASPATPKRWVTIVIILKL